MTDNVKLDFSDYLQERKIITIFNNEYYILSSSKIVGYSIVLHSEFLPENLFLESRYKRLTQYLFNFKFRSRLGILKNNITFLYNFHLKSFYPFSTVYLKKIDESYIHSLGEKLFIFSLNELGNFNPCILFFEKAQEWKIIESTKLLTKQTIAKNLPAFFKIS